MNLTPLTKVLNLFSYDFLKKQLGDTMRLLSPFSEDELEIIKGQTFI